jgi:IS5 family transposase
MLKTERGEVMVDQPSFASLSWSRKGKVTRRERFLAEMDAVIPWAKLVALIEPDYPKGETGRPPKDLERMLRIYFLQQWFNLSHPQAEDSIYDSESMRRFAKVELSFVKVPEETTILRFRRLLEQHKLTATIFEGIKDLLESKRLFLYSGTIVDATIVAAPSSTKNELRTRDPEMKQTRKGKTWHFGMKFHVGTDRRGTVDSLTATHAAVSDLYELPNLLHGEERVLYGDQAYWKQADREAFEAAGVRYRVNRRGAHGNKSLTEHEKAINRSRSRIRARGKHAFRIVKQLCGFTKTRYRGIEKNLARGYTIFALANLYALRHRLLPRGRGTPCDRLAGQAAPSNDRCDPMGRGGRPSTALRHALGSPKRRLRRGSLALDCCEKHLDRMRHDFPILGFKIGSQ